MTLSELLRPIVRPVLFACALTPIASLAACAHHADAVTVREVSAPAGLRYGLEIDGTRLSRGSGLPPVAAVAQLVEQNLAAFFRLVPGKPGAPSDERREILAEAPAPGYGVRVVIEARPDDFCHVSIDVVTLKDGKTDWTTLAPYSVHYGVSAVRAAMDALRAPNRPLLAPDRFDALRKQATELRAQGKDPAIDDAEFARTPRPLEKLDEAPRYYAPVTEPSTVRPE
jgi:hypothetical protein